MNRQLHELWAEGMGQQPMIIVRSTLMLLLIARTKFSDFSDQSHYR